ncbi:MAG: hypothetical protein P8J78_06705 [Maricaulis sp.]|jgi:hypothetical protein|nr:hypothetical protein [Maricaulis sp.]MDG2044283.1 hypothetical protein [Maricaulis sp.]
MLSRISSVTSTLFLSMILAMIMMAASWFYTPDIFLWLQDGADIAEDLIASIPLPDEYQNLVRIYASDDKILLLIFTVLARILLAILGSLMGLSKTGANILARSGSAVSTIFLSFILAVLMLSTLALTAEGLLHTLLNGADWVEDGLANLPLEGRWRSGVRLVVSDEKILLLFFTMIARAAIAVVATSFTAAVRSRD